MKLEKTDDGSFTLYVPEMDEHYHSTKGALTEARHIFIEMGLKHSSASHPHILEIGFGTGLNAFLTLLAAEEIGKRVHYTGIERFPLGEETIRALDYPHLINAERAADYYRMHQVAWEKDEPVTEWFTLHKMENDFTSLFQQPASEFSGAFDVIYFDAFAPEKQPEMWEQALFDSLYAALKPGGILTTYCAKGVVRRMLQAAGFTVERLPGPPGGKREILRATKND